jgi:hypothetical protein
MDSQQREMASFKSMIFPRDLKHFFKDIAGLLIYK